MAKALRRSAVQLIKSKNFPTTSTLRNKTSNVGDEKNIIRSVYKDIPTLNCSVNDFVWHNLDRWPDKTATVRGLYPASRTRTSNLELKKAFQRISCE